MRIAQITDSHVVRPGALWKGRVDMAEALARAVGRVNALAPDIVIHTGDLVETGDASEYGLAAEILDDLSAPLRLVPGNHDDRAAMESAFPDHVWEEPFLQFSEDREGLRLIGLDTVDPGATAGTFCEERASFLRDRLSGDGPAMIFLHHPPCPMGLPYMDRFVFSNGELIAEAVAGRPVLRLACGHVHAAAERHWAGTLVAACPALGVQIPPAGPADGPMGYTLEPAAIRLFDWTSELGLTAKTIPVDAYPGPFPFETDPNADLSSTPGG